MVRKMPKASAGELLMAMLSFSGGEEYEITDAMVDVVFEGVKSQMERDKAKWDTFRQKQAENGKLGGRPKKPKDTQPNPENPSLSGETQKSLTVTVTATVKNNTEKFDIFWSKYPNKTGKKAAKAKFIKLPASDIEKIMATIDAFVAHKPFPTYNHPHATTYLNGERWNDEVPADPSAPPLLKQKPADTSSWSEYDHLCWDVSFTPSLLKDYNCARDCLGNTTEAEKRGIYKRFFNQDTLELIDIFIKR